MLAYLDAGTGQMIVAALAGGAAGVGVLFRMYGNRFLGVFSKKRRRQAELAQGEILGVEIDPETGLPVEPADGAPASSKDDQSTIGERS